MSVNKMMPVAFHIPFFCCVLIEYECVYMKDYKLLSTTTFEGPIGRLER